MSDFIISPACEVEIQLFEHSEYKSVISLIHDFIKREDLYDADIIGMHCEYAKDKWYASLIYRGDPVEDDKEEDNKTESFQISKTQTLDNSTAMTCLWKI